MIGNAATLPPETLGVGAIPSSAARGRRLRHVFETLIDRRSYGEENANALRAEFLCPEGQEPARTGTPLALDGHYPEGGPLADRD